MFSRRVISLLVVLSFVSQALVVVDTDNSSNFVEDSSPLQQVSEYGAPRSGHYEIENATLLKDINAELRDGWPKGSNPQRHFAHTDGNLYWSANDNSGSNDGIRSNYEMWSSDGTEDGTYMVKDIYPGEGNSSSPAFYASMGDILFFAADNGTTGHELWRTDGTEEGTYMVKDICTQYAMCDGIEANTLSAEYGAWPISVNDEFILFPAQNITGNEELWRSDGTENGTYMVKDIKTFDDDGSKPRHFRLLGDDKVIFSAISSGNNRELWITDGTEEGTQLVKDINSGSDGGNPQWFTMLDDVYYFMAEDENYKRELWRTDGTTNGTYRLTALGTGSTSGLLSPALPFRDFLVFEGYQAWPDEQELYKYDPSTNETTLITNFEQDSDAYEPRLRFVVNDKIVFQMYCEGYCDELWTTDGTEVSSSFFFNNTLDSDRFIFSPMMMPPTRGQPHFNTYFPVHENVGIFTTGYGENEGIWATDGTTNGTYRITYNLTGINDGHIAGGNLFFSAFDTVHGEEMRVIRNFTTTAYHTLYKDKVMDPITFDYSLESTYFPGEPHTPFMVKDINPGDDGDGAYDIVTVGDTAYFRANDGTHGSELWKSNGTENGTMLVKDINPSGSSDSGLLDRTIIPFNDNLIFVAWNGSSTGPELWISNGTENGTSMLKEIDTGDTSWIKDLTVLGNYILFSAEDNGIYGRELWRTDGTTEGTEIVKDINPGTADAQPQNFYVLNDVLYFSATNSTYGQELWRSDGTAEGTYIVKDINPGSDGDSYPQYLSSEGNTLFFVAKDGTNGYELWKSNGTSNGTVMVKDINSDSSGSFDTTKKFQLVSFNGEIYFPVDDDSGNGVELWKSNGTADGTVMVKDIRSGSESSIPMYVDHLLHKSAVELNGFLYFAANDGVKGRELWSTNGTEDGTTIVKDIRNGGTGSSPREFLLTADRIFFKATSGTYGKELFVTNGTSTTLFHDFYGGGNTQNNHGLGQSISYLTLSDTALYLAAQTFNTGYELWRIDNVSILDEPTWEIHPDLPASLSFNLANGTITGTPDQLFSFISYTVYANGSVSETYKIRLQSLQYPDTDGDGVCDGASAVSGICTAGPDAFPFDAAASVDTDGDGMPDTLTGNSTSEPPLVEDLDDDNDGLLDLDEIANGTEPLNPDTDGDGYCDGSVTVGSCIAGDVFPLDENEWFDTDGDGTGNNADTDDDNDGLDDTTEASSDPVTNSTNPDTDGDGVCDGSVNVTINDAQICIGGPDELPTDPDETIDTDGDGIGNNGDTDDDNDGLSDDEENELGTDPLDPDTDGDFYCDGPIVVAGCAGSDDAFPLDDSEWLDTDGDGIGNNIDPDDDGDSYDDIWEIDNDYDPLDGCDPNLNSSACDQDNDGLNNGEEITLGTNVTNPDTDGDGFCDGDLGVEGICVAGPDDFPLDPAAHLDTDGDGMPDTINGTSTSEPALIEDLDDDNDGLNDTDETVTNSTNPDTDGDGYCDGSVTVGSCIAGDVFPLDENEWFDTDGDGTGNNADTDDDNDGLNDTTEASSDPVTNSTNPDTDGDGYCDGPVSITDVCDATDAFPIDETEWFDTDGDGTGNNVDTDDDNDGLDDTTEASSDPVTNSTNPDTDGDGYCDGPVSITDVCDATDAFPTDETEWLDTDGNEIGNNADPDDDGDGYNDAVEVAEGSDPLDIESIPLDTDGDFDPDSTDPDDDNDEFDDGDDDFPTNSAEWLDTDDDGTGNNADTDDDGDGLTDEDEAALGSDPLIVDTDADGIPDNWDPMPVDPDGDFDKDGILDRDEYKPNADGEPADADGDGVNDMLQEVASGSSTSISDRSWRETCWWILLILLLLLIPLLKRRYDNSLVYDPDSVEYVIGDKDQSKIRMVPSLHEYTEKYINTVNSEGLRRITYAISGNLVEGLNIDSKTGIISGHPEKGGEYKYEVVMKHSKGKFKGEVTVNVLEEGKKSEKEQEPAPVLSSSPEPENTTAKPKFEGGTGTMMDPFVIKPAKGLEPGEEIESKQVITISGLESGGMVNMQDLNSKKNEKRFAIVAEPDEVGRQSALVADDDGKIKFRVNFKDDEPSTDGAEYESLIKLGTASVYLSWAVDVAKEESEEEPEEEAPLSKEEKKQKELERVKARSEKIDFEILGKATSSALSKPVEKDASEIELEDASKFNDRGTATITDADGSEIITWTSRKENALFGIAGLTRTFVAASIVVAKDDLQTIKGIGPFIEEKLNALGIYKIEQIAKLTSDLEDEVNIAIEFFPGRVKRDEWVKQAKELVEE
jgi:ELWxxDGT repeat protein